MRTLSKFADTSELYAGRQVVGQMSFRCIVHKEYIGPPASKKLVQIILGHVG